MHHNMKNTEKNKRDKALTHNFSFTQVSVHSIIYILRGSCLCSMNYIIRRNPEFASVDTNKLFNNIIYAFQLNTFQIFCVLNSIINEDHFEYMLSLVLILHNVMLTFVLLYIIENQILKFIIVPIILTGTLYLIEFIYTIKLIGDQKASHSFDTFKKIGADKKINEAFHIRKIVRYLSIVDMFLVLLINARFFLPPVQANLRIDFSVIGILVFTLVQELIINTQSELENNSQRKIAIVLSIIKAVAMIMEIVFVSFQNFLSSDSARTIKIILYADILVVSILLSVYLIKDLANYGCGLKATLQFKTRKIKVS